MKKDPFEERRQSDPQGLINDLVAQTVRQAKAIHELTKEVEQLKKQIQDLEKK
jgi:polyhydroxyalkanoate synthesis regulator phasin